MPTSLDTVIIASTRHIELAEFYRAALRLDEMSRFGQRHVGVQVGPLYLGFDLVEAPADAPGRVAAWFAVDDVENTFDHLVRLGAHVLSPPTLKPWGQVVAAVKDPDGNTLGIASRREPADE